MCRGRNVLKKCEKTAACKKKEAEELKKEEEMLLAESGSAANTSPFCLISYKLAGFRPIDRRSLGLVQTFFFLYDMSNKKSLFPSFF